MAISNYYPDRGKMGRTPSLTLRADEAANEFLSDARNFILHAQWRNMMQRGNKALADHGVKSEHSKEGVAKARAAVADDIYVNTFLRMKRSAQEMYKQRLVDSYLLREADYLRRMDDAEKRGPGTLSYDPNYIYPDYAKVEIHLQHGGYVGHPLAGLFYDYGTSIFYGGNNEDDALHIRIARDTAVPQDGKLNRIMEIGCGIGQLAVELKRLHPNAEVHATDISAPMIRYGHWRATEQNMEVHFSQMACEALDFPDNHFDLITSHIVFHEIPLPVIDKTLAEIKRVLRPGGTFVMWDFITATKDTPAYSGLIGLMDAADNCEPYAQAFVTCDVESRMEKLGFTLRARPGPGVMMGARVADKPA